MAEKRGLPKGVTNNPNGRPKGSKNRFSFDVRTFIYDNVANDCSKVIAIKEASGKLDQIEEIIKGSPKGFSVISGDDAVTTAVIDMGGIGVISVFGNAFPKEMSWLVDCALKGDSINARNKMEEDFNELFHLIFIEGNPAGVKSILSQKGIIKNRLRLPLVPVSDKTALMIKEALSKAKYL
jgi:4-hydroxy-tetrahydrodipicolinate synthase